MSKKTIPVAEATDAQIREYATIHKGLDVDGRATRQSMIAKLHQAGADVDTITVFVVETDTVKRVAPEETGNIKHENGRTYRRINIATQEAAGGEEPVSVSVNGRAMFIPRGQDCWVPAEYVEVLNHAEQYIYEQFDGSDLGGLKKPRIVKSYPFSYV